MKKVEPPVNNDRQELVSLSENIRLSSYPELKDNLDVILGQYEKYLEEKGNPWVLNTCNLTTSLQVALKLHYKSKIKDSLEFLKSYRDKLSPDLCLMCGGLGMGTLDHYLPKDDYAEFSIYSKNLVPACSCNSTRGTTVMGDTAPKRVIHPYYDDFLGERLYQSVFSGDFLTPKISIDLINANDMNSEILKFHLDEVIKKNNIVGWFEKIWSNLTERGHDILELVLDEQEINPDGLRNSIRKWVRSKDKEYGTPNNWYSFFYQGLLVDTERLRLLADRINELRSRG